MAQATKRNNQPVRMLEYRGSDAPVEAYTLGPIVGSVDDGDHHIRYFIRND